MTLHVPRPAPAGVPRPAGASRPAGRPPLPAEELTRRKRAILDATLVLVAAKGTDAVRLRDVARAAGVSVGSLQYYFESRDQLIQEAFDQHARQVIDVVRQADDPLAAPWDRLVALLEAAVMRRDLRQSAALWMEFTSASLHDEQLRALVKGTYEAWRNLLAEIVGCGIEAGTFRPVLSPDLVVSCLVALIDGFELAVAIDVHDATPQAVLEKLAGTARVLLAGRS
jgi:AcrR family transcriptional regulator